MTASKPAVQVRQKVITIVSFVLVLVLLIGTLGFQILLRVLYPTTYSNVVEHWATEYEIDPYLVYAVIRTESSFRPGAESQAGARGLMQMTEDTFDWIKSRIAEDEALEYGDLYQPETAIRFGAYYLSISLERYGGDVSTAAAAYHSGWGTVDRLLESEISGSEDKLTEFPFSQMQHYVNKVNKAHANYIKLYT